MEKEVGAVSPRCSECRFVPPYDLLIDLAAAPRTPQNGDFWICGECGALMTVRENAWVLATEEDKKRMGPGGRARVEILQKRIREARPS